MPDIPEWMADALCAQTDPEIFHPEKGGSTAPAKAICAKCDVVASCLQYALDNGERYGVYGGKSERERRRMQKGQTLTPTASDERAARDRRIVAAWMDGATHPQLAAQFGISTKRIHDIVNARRAGEAA